MTRDARSFAGQVKGEACRRAAAASAIRKRREQRQGRYLTLIREAFRENGRDVLRVMVKRGDVVLFHGRLIHGGAPVRRPDTARYALACHYIPYHSENWDREWPRISFDGARRVHYRNGAAGD